MKPDNEVISYNQRKAYLEIHCVRFYDVKPKLYSTINGHGRTLNPRACTQHTLPLGVVHSIWHSFYPVGQVHGVPMH